MILPTLGMNVLFLMHLLFSMSYIRISPCFLHRVCRDVYWLVTLSNLMDLLSLSANSEQYLGWTIEPHQLIGGNRFSVMSNRSTSVVFRGPDF